MGTKFRGGLIFAFFADRCVIAKFYHHENLLVLVTPTIHIPIKFVVSFVQLAQENETLIQMAYYQYAYP